VIPAGVSSIAVVGRDHGHAVGMRNAQKRYGAGLPRLRAGSGEDDRRQPGGDPGEAMPAPVRLLTSWSKRCAVGRKRTRPAFVAATPRIARWNTFASSKERIGIAVFFPQWSPYKVAFRFPGAGPPSSSLGAI
jgi:hypothetical protein